MQKVMVTCPPMLGLIDEFIPVAAERGIELVPAQVTQTLSEEELIALLPNYDGWIIGDDPATRRVFEAARRGRLKVAVKWGIGVDNVDFAACKDLGIPITNTPNMFGEEVADVAVGYVIGLARQLFLIDRGVREGGWPKPAGMSLSGKCVGLIGFGDIGRATAKRLSALGLVVTAYDPANADNGGVESVKRAIWPDGTNDLDFLIFTCSLNEQNRRMLNEKAIAALKRGVHVINVARGGLIDESALLTALRSGHVAGAALDVFEQEPLPASSELRSLENCIFGSHNASNTAEAVRRTSLRAIDILFSYTKHS